MKYNIALLSIVIILFSSCKKEKDATVEEKDNGLITVSKEQFETMGMAIATPLEQDFDVTVKTSGRIDVPPKNKARISTFVGGYVKSTTLLVGDKVTKGQALLVIESTEIVDMQKDYLEVAEQIAYLKSEYERQKTLYTEKITSQKNYLKAESEYRSAKGRYQSLKEKLLMLHINVAKVEQGKIASTITLYAPIAGDITVMNATVGMAVAPSDIIMEIVDGRDLHIEMNVFEKDILNIKENQKVLFTVPEASKEVFEGKVHLIGKSIEGTDRTTNVHGHLDETVKQKLLTGMFIDANIVVNTKRGLGIPKDAVGLENEKNFVLLLKSEDKNGYSFQKVVIEKGASTENFIEVIPSKAINAQSKILTKGVFDLIN